MRFTIKRKSYWPLGGEQVDEMVGIRFFDFLLGTGLDLAGGIPPNVVRQGFLGQGRGR